MAKITLNGREVEVKDGQNLIAACASVGTEIPHYCYHPGLPIDGNCRMCLVEVEGLRGPQIACNTFAKDGMVVKTDTPAVEGMRKATQEFLLHNHPVDCPICDQAGECRLQDYYMQYGRYDNRSPLPKIEKEKVVDIGPLVVLDQERCILCSRCVRFSNEISKSGELVITGRGDRSRIEVFPGHELANAYSGNTVDVCPVGALTSKDFRFKQRVWFLTPTKSVCSGCSRGCNINADHRGETVFRFRPRANLDVNQYWMCDEGRLSYKQVGTDRLRTALRRVGGGAEGQPAVFGQAWLAALEQLGRLRGQKVAVFASPLSSLEDNAALLRFAREVLRTDAVVGACWKPDGIGDDFLITADKTPNRKGLEVLGIPTDPQAALAALQGAAAVVVLENDLRAEAPPEVRQALDALPVVSLSGWRTATALAAEIAFPIAAHLEASGTFVNVQGRLQRFLRAYDATGDGLVAWELLARLAEALGVPFGWADVEDVWAYLKGAFHDLAEVPSFYGIGDAGLPLARFQVPLTPGQERSLAVATRGK